MRRTSQITIASLLALAAFSGSAFAGPLNPPAGPVASTMKTMTEVEPRIAINATNTPGNATYTYVISQPGSYYLTGNLTGASGKHGIAVATTGVTIDLSGFELIGVPGSSNGIFVTDVTAKSFTLRNGTVRNWGNNGINTATQAPQGVVIEDVKAIENASFGFFCGSHTRISRCYASGNGLDGFNISLRSVVTDCVASNNGQEGFEVFAYSVVRGCESRSNAVFGIYTGTGCTVTDCVAIENTQHGINAGSDNVVRGCHTSENHSIGINTGAGCRVSDNLSSLNDLDGIRVSAQCVVTGNTSNANGQNSALGAGFKVTGIDNRLEGNNSTGQDTGYDIDVAGNILVRNTASGNTDNWAVIAGNKCLVILGVNCANILGDSGGVSPGSTDPNANFTY